MDQSIILPELPTLPRILPQGVAAPLSAIIDYLTKEREALIASHDELARAINDLAIILTPAVGAAFTVTNVTTDRAYDADTVVVAELADAVGTLIADLKLREII